MGGILMAYYDPALEAAAGNDPYTGRYESDPATAADEPTFSPADPAAHLYTHCTESRINADITT